MKQEGSQQSEINKMDCYALQLNYHSESTKEIYYHRNMQFAAISIWQLNEAKVTQNNYASETNWVTTRVNWKYFNGRQKKLTHTKCLRMACYNISQISTNISKQANEKMLREKEKREKKEETHKGKNHTQLREYFICIFNLRI